MGRPKKITDEELIRGARECFLAHGPNVSTEVIAQCVGVSQAAIFKRYSTKEELLIAALVIYEKPEWFRALQKGPDDRPIQEQVGEIVRNLVEFIESKMPRLAILHAAGIDIRKAFKDPKDAPLYKLTRILTGWFRRASKRGLIGKVDANALTFSLIGAAHFRPMFNNIFGQSAPNRVGVKTHIKSLTETILNGIAPEEDK